MIELLILLRAPQAFPSPGNKLASPLAYWYYRNISPLKGNNDEIIKAYSIYITS